MNDVKQMFSKFTNLSGMRRLDKNNETDSITIPSYADTLYTSSKNDREVYNELYKKMSNICVQNYFVTDDKKMKKNTWESMLNLLSESENKLSDDTLTKDLMSHSIKVVNEMAHVTKEFERNLSVNVIKHFQELSEDNTLTQTKKSLTSLSKDMKSNSEKVKNLQDQLNIPTNDMTQNRKQVDINNIVSTDNKLVTAQILEENTEKEWENKKDLHLSKLFAVESEKFTTAEKYLKLFQDYHDYYTECQRILSSFIPEMKNTLDKTRNIYAFHVPLEDHLAATNRKLSYVLETCIQELDNVETLQHEGLFRISGSKTKIELLKNALNVMRMDEFITKGFDSAVYTGVLKQYLRELPIPLMTYDLYDKWCEIGAKIRQNDIEKVELMITDCLSQMPTCYYDNLAYLIQFLRKITENEPINKMSASNLGLMLGPNLIRNNQVHENEESDAAAMLMIGSPGGSVLEYMIKHYLIIFPNAPVYSTATRPPLKVLELSLSEKDTYKSVKKIGHANDTDSLSSTDLVHYDSNISIIGSESNDSQIGDQCLKSPRDLSGDARPVKKMQIPPPPPLNKPYLIENDHDTVKPLIVTRPEKCPTITKRSSKVDKHTSDSMKDTDASVTDSPNRRVISSHPVVQRPSYVPQLPPKKPATPPSLPEKPPARPENPPPRRPNNPPPPVPSFNKLKENLDHKQSEVKETNDIDLVKDPIKTSANIELEQSQIKETSDIDSMTDPISVSASCDYSHAEIYAVCDNDSDKDSAETNPTIDHNQSQIKENSDVDSVQDEAIYGSDTANLEREQSQITVASNDQVVIIVAESTAM